MRYKIIATALPKQVEDDLRHHHEQLQSGRSTELIYAVRSSATAEDLATASFAGQHDTYYYVDHKSLSMMVKKCWASLWSDAAFSYRQSQGIEHHDVKMAVIIQEMVHSETSGVTFTADPVSGAENVIITESSWGMGAAIVDGRVSPDQYVVDKESGLLTSIKVADKKFMVPPTLEKDDVSRLQSVPAHLRRVESLTTEQVDTITRWAKRSEEYFGSQQDLEWAFAGGEFFILQSRAITVIGEIEEEEPVGKFVLFKPLVENFTDPLLPLSQNLLLRIFPVMTIIHGRAYMKLSDARALVPLKISDADLATLAYLGNPDNFKPRISIPRLVGLSFLLMFSYLTFAVLYRRTNNMPDDFMDNYRLYFNKVVEDPNINAPQTLMKLLLDTRFFEPIGNMVLMANIAAPRYIFLLALLGKLLKRWAPGLSSDAPSLLSSGTQGVLSTEMGREIWQLAKTVKSNPLLAKTILDLAPNKALAAVRSQEGSGEFVAQLTVFLHKHGHRTLKEFELNSIRWEEDPSPILAMIRNYLLADSDPEATEAKVEQQRQSLISDVKQRLSALPFEKQLGIRFKIISYVRNKAKYFIKLRENSRFYHIMGFYAVRKKILVAESELMAKGSLKCKDDIFYLNWREIEELQTDTLFWSGVEDRIRLRRIHHIRLGKMRPPKTVGIKVETIASAEPVGNQISGQPASPGTYRGKARVIMDPATDAKIEPGEILVAPYTDPAWTPLFLIANAAVIEIGSYLSHAGTIAREYGMPCVVDVTNCTSHITTGDVIEVDGSTGKVTLLALPEDNGSQPEDVTQVRGI
jgi:pyruvate,water dikinase